MKRIFQLCFSLAAFSLGFSQELRPIAQKVKNSQIAHKNFVKYNLFTVDNNANKQALYSQAAEGVTVMKLNQTEIQKINAERPEALEMNFPFEGKDVTVELVKSNIFTHDFKVNTDKGYVNYTPGVYYYGIVKGDNESLVAISFFNNEVMGVTSIKNVGNIVLGKTTDSDSYVTYNDQKLKGTNPFTCSADELPENKISNLPAFDPQAVNTQKTSTCVRIYYEVGYGPYVLNQSNVTTTVNWATAMHNNVAALYTNDNVNVAISEVYVWTSTEPYPNVSSTNTPSVVLASFRSGRTSFNGDVAQLLKNPANTSVAYLNSLCGNSNYSFCGVNKAYSNVPTYSWNIMAMAHETGHSLGSPHTHACYWNGNNTQIDGCGPASGNPDPSNGNCDAGPLPTNGGTIMSYCHLVSSVGVNFANGFGPQPSTLIRNTVNSKSCLGTDCVNSCNSTISGLSITNIATGSLTATILDATGTAWKYKVAKTDGTIVQSGNTTNKVLNITGLEEGKYYIVSAANECSGPEAFPYNQLVLTDANWCSGTLFTDSGGESGNYRNGESFVKTFYPTSSSDKLKLTFTEFNTEVGSDFMNIYDGPSTGSPRFSNGIQLNGTTVPGPFTSTHATGAITVRFISNANNTSNGWKANFECLSLGTNETSASNAVTIAQTSVKGVYTISAKDKVLSYQVYDASGKQVKVSGIVNALETKVDLSAAPKGSYVVTVTTTKETVTKKIVR